MLRRVIESPTAMRRLNGWATVVWAGMIPVAVATGLVNSVPFVSALSLWALVSGHLSAWQSARVEVQLGATPDDPASDA